MPIPADYEERVYAGVLGKIIGVYLGRPFEGWPRHRIEAELGDIDYYVHERLGQPLVVSDDDISGTFTFLRALEDHGVSADLTAEQIGETWLNYLIEKRTILWWGGMGTSTEHTAFLRLKHGVKAPDTGSIALNGQVVAEQIGAQIFIDGWAMVAPGEPELAARLAREAASVSHDGEAIHGAQVIAAMEGAAFVESDMDRLLDIGLSVIPDDCLIARLITDLRQWHAQDPDWRTTFERVEAAYGYDRYGGGCHMVPNHAIIILALLYGEGDFQRSLMIANTAGWDTDCNAGNVGCLIGIRGGLAAIDAGPDFRGPVADRLYKISADGGDAFSDAVHETERICAMGRQLMGQEPAPPRDARYHFELPGSVQGFEAAIEPDAVGACSLSNVAGHSETGTRSLAIQFQQIAPGRPARAGVQVYALPSELGRAGYYMTMSPRLQVGQTMEADVELDSAVDGPVQIGLFVQVFGNEPGAEPSILRSPRQPLAPCGTEQLRWTVPGTGGLPIVRVGLEISSMVGTSGCVYLDRFTWDGAPDCDFTDSGLGAYREPIGWTNGVDRAFYSDGGRQLTLIQDEGRGLLMTGTRDWRDLRFSAQVTPHMAAAAGIAVRVGGMRRGIALLLCQDRRWRLVEWLNGERVLQEGEWLEPSGSQLSLSVSGDTLRAAIDGIEIAQVANVKLSSGGVALINTEGRSFFREVNVAHLA